MPEIQRDRRSEAQENECPESYLEDSFLGLNPWVVERPGNDDPGESENKPLENPHRQTGKVIGASSCHSPSMTSKLVCFLVDECPNEGAVQSNIATPSTHVMEQTSSTIASS